MITADELTKRFRSTLAVDRLSFEVAPGRVTGFLGPNGAGKSTTMRMVLGLDTPTGGRGPSRCRRTPGSGRPGCAWWSTCRRRWGRGTRSPGPAGR